MGLLEDLGSAFYGGMEKALEREKGEAANAYAQSLNALNAAGSSAKEGLTGKGYDYPIYTKENVNEFWKGLAGDEAARETPVTMASGRETTFSGVPGYGKLTEVSDAAGGFVGDVAEQAKGTVENIGGAIEGAKSAIDENWPDIKTGLEGLARTAQYGALAELWGMANSAFSSPVSHTVNTIEQALSATNKRDI